MTRWVSGLVLPVEVHLEAVHVPEDADGADGALDLGLCGDESLSLGDVRLLVVPLQVRHDLRDVLWGQRAEVALKVKIRTYTGCYVSYVELAKIQI